jgi:hypothetical protein
VFLSALTDFVFAAITNFNCLSSILCLRFPVVARNNLMVEIIHGQNNSRQIFAAARFLRGGFAAEYALETGAGKVDAYHVFAGAGGGSYMYNAALGGEVGFVFAAGVMAVRDANFQIRADGDIKAGDKSGAAAA